MLQMRKMHNQDVKNQQEKASAVPVQKGLLTVFLKNYQVALNAAQQQHVRMTSQIQ